MATYEIYVPATHTDDFNITAHMQAESWMGALRLGLERLGDVRKMENVLCDITDEGVNVTEPDSGRVFHLRQVDDIKVAPQAHESLTFSGPVSEVAETTAVPPHQVHEPLIVADQGPVPAEITVLDVPPSQPPVTLDEPVRLEPIHTSIDTTSESEILQLQAVPTDVSYPTEPAPEMPAVEQQWPRPASEQLQSEPAAIGRLPEVDVGRIDEILCDLFTQTASLYDFKYYKDAAQWLLELAMGSIPSGSGAVFVADINQHELTLLSTEGDWQGEGVAGPVLMGEGIAGFAAQHGVTLALSDVEQHPEFASFIAQMGGSQTRSLLCAPVQQSGRCYGAMALRNRCDNARFLNEEVSVMSFLSHQFCEYLIRTEQTGG